MLPEEQELSRLELDQAQLEEQVVTAELERETEKTDIARFQRRYYETVGQLYVELDELLAGFTREKAKAKPEDVDAQAQAEASERQARKSAEEAGLIEAHPALPREIAPACKKAYRKAAQMMHPDRATTTQEIQRRTALMAKLNFAYESGNQQAIEKLMLEFGQDPEAIAGEDVASRIVKTIRRIAQLRRRLSEIQQELDTQKQSEIYQLKTSVEEAELMGGDPLGDLAQQLLRELSEQKIRLAMTS
ncbi:MAG: J domain-containing protein [Nitrosospira sp.]|nr:J domain-containing protein [Nitrosospira sp.]